MEGNHETESQVMDQKQLRELSTADLVKHAMEEAKLLAKAEILHAKLEIKEELNSAKSAGVFLGTGFGLAIWGVGLLLVALALALPLPQPISALVIGLVLLVGAGICAAVGFRKVPKKPLEKTQKRIKTDWTRVREKLA